MSDATTHPSSDLLTEQILDAAIEAASVHGIARTSMSDVARRAGISRPTLYKRFGSKDELVMAAVLREANLMTTSVADAVAPFSDPAEALREGVTVALRLARDHPLLDRTVRTEPESLVPLLVSDPSPVLTFVRSAVASILVARTPELSQLALRRVSDLLARLLISYALSAPDDPPEIVAEYLATFLIEGLADPVALSRALEEK